MIFNDTLKTYRECLEQCEIKSELCQLDEKDKESCETEKEQCTLECDFDYGP